MPFDREAHVGVGAFTDDAAGLQNAPVSSAVRMATRKTSPERVYDGMPRMWKITNRGEKGALAGKPWACAYEEGSYPEGATSDERTWLQVGEAMVVSRDVMLHICGNVYDPRLPDKQDIIQRYGDWEYDVQPTADGTVAGRVPIMSVIGPPTAMPDLLIEPMDLRAKAATGKDFKRISLLETYTKGVRYAKPQMEGDKRRKDLILV